MARILDQFFRAGERVLHHVPEGRWLPNWRTRLAGMTAFGALVPLLSWFALEPAQGSKIAIFWVVAWVVVWAVVTGPSLLEDWSVETAVTERRALRVAMVRTSDNREIRPDPTGSVTAGEQMRYTEVKLDEVASVMALGETVAITKTDGSIVFLEHRDHASDIASAIAHAIGLAPPRTSLMVRVASNVMLVPQALACVAGVAFNLFPIPDIDGIFQITLNFIAVATTAYTAGMAAELLVIVAFRAFLGKVEMRACIQEARMWLFSTKDPNKPGAFTRFVLRFLDWLYRQAPAKSLSLGERNSR